MGDHGSDLYTDSVSSPGRVLRSRDSYRLYERERERETERAAAVPCTCIVHINPPAPWRGGGTGTSIIELQNHKPSVYNN